MNSTIETNCALSDEIEAINSIYGADTLSRVTPVASDKKTESGQIGSDNLKTALLKFPGQPSSFSFVITFPLEYPDSSSPPVISGPPPTQSSSKSKGESTAIEILRDVLAHVWTPGQVCLFDVIEEATPLLVVDDSGDGGGNEITTTSASEGITEARSTGPVATAEQEEETANNDDDDDDDDDDVAIAAPPTAQFPPPEWTISEPIIEKKSVFVARCAPVSTKDEAAAAITSLLVATDKKIAGATHNITAWRVRSARTASARMGPTADTEATTTVLQQDCDDDGETAAGGRLLHLMQLMDVWNVVVVVSRWYGGTKLGPDRFRIINAVARDSLVRGGFVGRDEKGEEAERGRKEKGGKKNLKAKMKKMK